MARAEVEKIAMAESPFSWECSESRRRNTAARITTGIATFRGARFMTAATDRAPKPTWDSPSPIMEYRLSTRLTPSRLEQRVTAMPPISAGSRITVRNSGVSIL